MKWKLVPVEPTPEMITAAHDAGLGVPAEYKAMLEAAPPPPALTDERILEIHREVLWGDAGGNRLRTVILMARAIEREILGRSECTS